MKRRECNKYAKESFVVNNITQLVHGIRLKVVFRVVFSLSLSASTVDTQYVSLHRLTNCNCDVIPNGLCVCTAHKKGRENNYLLSYTTYIIIDMYQSSGKINAFEFVLLFFPLPLTLVCRAYCTLDIWIWKRQRAQERQNEKEWNAECVRDNRIIIFLSSSLAHYNFIISLIFH